MSKGLGRFKLWLNHVLTSSVIEIYTNARIWTSLPVAHLHPLVVNISDSITVAVVFQRKDILPLFPNPFGGQPFLSGVPNYQKGR